MKESEFQFSTPVLSQLSFCINEDYDRKSRNGTIGNSFKVNIDRSKTMPEALVSLSLMINDIDDDELDMSVPFGLYAKIAANFTWNHDSIDEKMLKMLLSRNAPSLLLGYLRPIVASITNCSPFPAYNIPFMNFTDNEIEE